MIERLGLTRLSRDDHHRKIEELVDAVNDLRFRIEELAALLEAIKKP